MSGRPINHERLTRKPGDKEQWERGPGAQSAADAYSHKKNLKRCGLSISMRKMNQLKKLRNAAGEQK